MLYQTSFLVDDEIPRGSPLRLALGGRDAAMIRPNVRACRCVSKRDEVLCAIMMVNTSIQQRNVRTNLLRLQHQIGQYEDR